MGKAARFACILTPMLLTIASLVCTILVLLGGTKQSVGWLNDLYFFKIDARYVTIPDSLDLFPGDLDDDKVKTGLKSKTNEELGLEDFYNIHLWNYCSGDYVEDGGKNKWKVTECTKPNAKYHFDLVEIFQIEAKENGGSGIEDEDLPDSITKVNKAIKTVSSVMISMYVIGTLTTLVTFLVGWFGLLSRWGSCVTTIFADISFFFLLAASSIATALFYTLKGGFNKALDEFGADTSVNNKVMALTWLGTAFAFGAALFWMLSTCCCSGRSSRVMGRDKGSPKSIGSEKGAYGYERVAAPYNPTSTAPAGGAAPGSVYEPDRKSVV